MPVRKEKLRKHDEYILAQHRFLSDIDLEKERPSDMLKMIYKSVRKEEAPVRLLQELYGKDFGRSLNWKRSLKDLIMMTVGNVIQCRRSRGFDSSFEGLLRLQKLVYFLCRFKINSECDFQYREYPYGVYSLDIEDSVEGLCRSKLLKRSRKTVKDLESPTLLRLTEEGDKRFGRLRRQLKKELGPLEYSRVERIAVEIYDQDIAELSLGSKQLFIASAWQPVGDKIEETIRKSYSQEPWMTFEKVAMEAFRRNALDVENFHTLKVGKSGQPHWLDFTTSVEKKPILVECKRIARESDIAELVNKVNDLDFHNGILIYDQAPEGFYRFSKRFRNTIAVDFKNVDKGLRSLYEDLSEIPPKKTKWFSFWIFSSEGSREDVLRDLSRMADTVSEMEGKDYYRLYAESHSISFDLFFENGYCIMSTPRRATRVASLIRKAAGSEEIGEIEVSQRRVLRFVDWCSAHDYTVVTVVASQVLEKGDSTVRLRGEGLHPQQLEHLTREARITSLTVKDSKNRTIRIRVDPSLQIRIRERNYESSRRVIKEILEPLVVERS